MIFRRSRQKPIKEQSTAEAVVSPYGADVALEIAKLVFEASLEDDRLELGKAAIERLPADQLIQLLGGMPLDNVLAAYREAEQYPALIDKLVEQGRNNKRIDFSLIPPGCQLIVRLHAVTGHGGPMTANYNHTLHLQSHGDGIFNLRQGMGRMKHGAHEFSISPDHALGFYRRDIRTGELKSDIEFGQPLGFVLHEGHQHGGTGEHFPLESLPRPNDPLTRRLSAGETWLNNRPVFDVPTTY